MIMSPQFQMPDIKVSSERSTALLATKSGAVSPGVSVTALLGGFQTACTSVAAKAFPQSNDAKPLNCLFVFDALSSEHTAHCFF